MNVNDSAFTGEFAYSMANFKIPMKKPSDMADVKSDTETNTLNEIPQSNCVQSLTKHDQTGSIDILTLISEVDHRAPQTATNGNDSRRPYKRSKSFEEHFGWPSIEGLPEELVKLFKPLCCDLCSTKLNSPITAQSHYESKNHRKKIQAWLIEWSSRTNEPIPKRPNLKVETTGSSSTHCDVCDLALTSVQHAKQHYMGKKHRNAIRGSGKPKGQGYYDTDNKWVRMKESDPTNRFGIGESFLAAGNESNSSAAEKSSTAVEQETTPTHDEVDEVSDGLSLLTSSSPAPPIPPQAASDAQATPEEIAKLKVLQLATKELGKYCDICEISVNSESHMRVHLAGAKHAKQLRKLGAPPYQDITIAHSLNEPLHTKAALNQPGTFDYSVFRTPSGQYYCNVCNLTVSSESMLAQHMTSKKHAKTAKLKK